MQLIESRQREIRQNKTTLVQSPLTTLGQEARWAYSTAVLSRQGTREKRWPVSEVVWVPLHYDNRLAASIGQLTSSAHTNRRRQY